MKAINILGDQGKGAGLPLQFHQRMMRRIWILNGNDLPAPVIPLPYKHRVSPERLRCCKILISADSGVPSSPRKVGTPLSAEMPAPVRTTIEETVDMRDRILEIFSNYGMAPPCSMG